MATMKLQIIMLGEFWDVPVTPTTTVGQLKHLISGRINEAPSRQKLCLADGRNITLDDDTKTVQHYGLISGSKLILLIKTLQVYVFNEKNVSSSYDVTENMTVQQLKTKISNVEKTPVDQFYLVYQGKSLESNRKLSEYNIQPGGTIQMNLRLRGG